MHINRPNNLSQNWGTGAKAGGSSQAGGLCHRRVWVGSKGILLITLFTACCCCNRPPTAELLVITHAKIWTGDPSQPVATALVARGGHFLYVGDDQGAMKRAGDREKVIDAEGARIIPGLIDAHLHLIGGGLQLSRLNLREVPDRDAFIDAVAQRAKATPKGRWIRGGRWSTESWPDPTQPNKAWIDSVTIEHPVLLSRMDGHGALANSMALKLAGIDRDGPPDPIGGIIERDPATHEPTGILKDAAIGLVGRHVPASSEEQIDRALRAAMVEANRHGITSVHTMSPWSTLAAFRRARGDGHLTLRIRQYVSEADWSPYVEKIKRFPADDWIRVPGFKQFMDGSLGSRTAYMAQPFADNSPDQPGWRGMLREVMSVPGRLEKMCLLADAAGLSPAIHAIGDQANHIVLDIYEKTASVGGPRSSRRLRIEHAQHLLPSDIARFEALGVIASMQPLHKADDARYAEQAIGTRRCQSSYAFRSLLDAGTHLAFGSDWPVVSLNPFLGVHAAVTGRSLDGKVFVPSQNITVEESMSAYTTGAAYAIGEEEHLGKIKPGYLADFVILQQDPFSLAPEAIKNVRVKATYVNGRRVWSE